MSVLSTPEPAMADHSDASQNRGPVVLAVTTALLVASSVFVILRLVSRIGVVRKISWDDYFIILAWVRARIPFHRGVITCSRG